MFFFDMRKRTKKRGELRFPPHHPKRPLAELWQRGATRTTNKKRFAQIGSKPFLFYSCPRGSINTKQCQV